MIFFYWTIFLISLSRTGIYIEIFRPHIAIQESLFRSSQYDGVSFRLKICWLMIILYKDAFYSFFLIRHKHFVSPIDSLSISKFEKFEWAHLLTLLVLHHEEQWNVEKVVHEPCMIFFFCKRYCLMYRIHHALRYHTRFKKKKLIEYSSSYLERLKINCIHYWGEDPQKNNIPFI